jgi:hypothetical protein
MLKFHPEKEFRFGTPHLSLNASNLLLLQQSNNPVVTRPNQLTLIQEFFTVASKPRAFNVDQTSKIYNRTSIYQVLSVNGCLVTITTMMMRQYLDRSLISKVILWFVIRRIGCGHLKIFGPTLEAFMTELPLNCVIIAQ